MSDVTFGYNGGGDLFLKFIKDDKTAFLTIQENKMHLLVTEDNRPPIYMDNMPYDFDLSKVVNGV